MDSDINFVIMDYLINEGFPEAAEKFRLEANIHQPGDTDTIQERVDIRNCIVKGDIQAAIEKIHDLNPEVCHSNLQSPPVSYDYIQVSCTTLTSFGTMVRNTLHTSVLSMTIATALLICPLSSLDRYADMPVEQLLENNVNLNFALLRLQLIELIKQCTADGSDISSALEFAATHLAPIAPTNPAFLRDLEYTMALLIFAPENRTPPIKALLEPSLRQQVAIRVNEAILESQGFARRARLKSLVRMRAWAEKEARLNVNVKKTLPDSISIWDSEDRDVEMKGNGSSGAMDASA